MTKILLFIIVAGTVAPPSLAQSYHENYGGSRVIRQSKTGLHNPAATQIGAGTMSVSARGNIVGGPNPGLPSVTMGGTIRTPGDNLYNGSTGVRRDGNGSVVYQDYMQAQQQMRMRQQRQMQMQMQMQQSYPQGNYYVPGSNGAAASYGSSSSAAVQYNNGVAGYGSYKK